MTLRTLTPPETARLLRVSDAWAAALTEPRRGFVDMLLALVGLGFAKEHHHDRFVELVAPEAIEYPEAEDQARAAADAGRPPPMRPCQWQLSLARDSTCALTTRGAWREWIESVLSTPTPAPTLVLARELFSRYITTRAITDVENLAMRASAWRDAGRLAYKSSAEDVCAPGDSFLLGPRPGHDANDLHVGNAVHVEKLDDAGKQFAVVSVDGGQRDDSGLQLIKLRARTFVVGAIGRWTTIDEAHLMRPLAGVADFCALAKAWGFAS